MPARLSKRIAIVRQSFRRLNVFSILRCLLAVPFIRQACISLRRWGCMAVFGNLDARLGHKNGHCRAAFVCFNFTAQGIDRALVVHSGACCGAVGEPLDQRFTFSLDHLFGVGPGLYHLAQIF